MLLPEVSDPSCPDRWQFFFRDRFPRPFRSDVFPMVEKPEFSPSSRVLLFISRVSLSWAFLDLLFKTCRLLLLTFPFLIGRHFFILAMLPLAIGMVINPEAGSFPLTPSFLFSFRDFTSREFFTEFDSELLRFLLLLIVLKLYLKYLSLRSKLLRK